jgi:hypothetical protein
VRGDLTGHWSSPADRPVCPRLQTFYCAAVNRGLGSMPCENVFPPPETARNQCRSTPIRPSEHIFAVSSLESTRAQPRATLSDLERSRDVHDSTRSSRPGRHQERLDADDVHHAREVVGEHVQRHLGRHLRQRLHQKARRPHTHLQRAERMFDRLAASTHRIRIFVQARLHGIDNVLVLPPLDAALRHRPCPNRSPSNKR